MTTATATETVPLERNVPAFLNHPKKMLIGGEWVHAASGKTFATYNPADGEVLTHVAEGDAEDIDRAVRRATGIRERFLDYDLSLRARTPHLEACGSA